MFSRETYIKRRNDLKNLMNSGIGFFPGNGFAAMNYLSNTYPFRQDSNFLYYFGIDQEDLAAVINFETGEEILFGNNRGIDDVVWMGPDSSMKDKADAVGIDNTMPLSNLEDYINKFPKDKIHYLPPYRGETAILLNELTGIPIKSIKEKSSIELTKVVISQRSIKEKAELDEIENALEISYQMNTLSMKLIKPGMYEREIYAAAEGVALALGAGISFPIIFSIHGETLHNHHHDNLMQDGNIAVLDSGAESLLHYASDITRTIPVSGKFSEIQKHIYQTVLNSQLEAIELIKPGISYKECHIKSAEVIFNGLKEIGLTKGNTKEAVQNGAHALFFPHGLGHMLGLDVHDMEGLGENLVGYNNEIQRSEQFGLAYLRFAKKMKTNHVLTVEPGCYFIPQLIDIWKSENKHADFINYEKVEEFKNFGGIRIEDDIVVTEDGVRVLGTPIPKSIEEVESVCSENIN